MGVLLLGLAVAHATTCQNVQNAYIDSGCCGNSAAEVCSEIQYGQALMELFGVRLVIVEKCDQFHTEGTCPSYCDWDTSDCVDKTTIPTLAGPVVDYNSGNQASLNGNDTHVRMAVFHGNVLGIEGSDSIDDLTNLFNNLRHNLAILSSADPRILEQILNFADTL